MTLYPMAPRVVPTLRLEQEAPRPCRDQECDGFVDPVTGCCAKCGLELYPEENAPTS